MFIVTLYRVFLQREPFKSYTDYFFIIFIIFFGANRNLCIVFCVFFWKISEWWNCATLKAIADEKDKKIRAQEAEQKALRAEVDNICFNFDAQMEDLFQQRLSVWCTNNFFSFSSVWSMWEHEPNMIWNYSFTFTLREFKKKTNKQIKKREREREDRVFSTIILANNHSCMVG